MRKRDLIRLLEPLSDDARILTLVWDTDGNERFAEATAIIATQDLSAVLAISPAPEELDPR